MRKIQIDKIRVDDKIRIGNRRGSPGPVREVTAVLRGEDGAVTMIMVRTPGRNGTRVIQRGSLSGYVIVDTHMQPGHLAMQDSPFTDMLADTMPPGAMAATRHSCPHCHRPIICVTAPELRKP